MSNPNDKVHYPGELESATAADRAKHGIPIDDRLFEELKALADSFGLVVPIVNEPKVV
jgi:LDH2 family malate/lactate/ureidoglycolate dehydrogenase